MIYLFRKEMKKWHSILWAVLASLVLSGFLGYVNYKKSQPSQITIATVNGKSIKLLDFQKSLIDIQSQIEMYREYAKMTGISVDMFLSMAGLLNPEKAAFDNCLNNRLLDTEKDYYNIELDEDDFLKELSQRLPANVKDQDGNINLDSYKIYLSRMHTRPSEFEERMEHSLEREFFEKFAQSSNYVSLNSVKENFVNNISKKKFDVLHFPFEMYLNKVKTKKINDKEITVFFNNNKETYRVPEKRKAFFWILNSEDYAKKITVDESQVLYFYDKNKDSLFRIQPKVKVRHILFKVEKNDSPEKIEDVLNKAKDIKKQVAQDYTKFLDLAKQFSDDKKTASNGGLIDFFDKGTYDPDFEKAAYRLMNKGDISDIIKTEEGFELIQLEERLPASSKSFESVQDEIIKTLKVKKTLNTLNADIQRVMYEVKTDSNAPMKFIAENKLEQKETGFLSEKDSQGEGIENILAGKIFLVGKKIDSFGAFDYKDDKVLYKIVNIQKSYIPEIKDIESEVLDAFNKFEAKKALKADLKTAKRDLLNKNKTLKEVADFYKLNIETTQALKKDDEAKNLNLDSSFTKKAFLLSNFDQALTYKKDSEYYLVQFKDIEQTSLISFTDEKSKMISLEKNENKGLYLQAFIASLLRNARIEDLEDYVNFEKRQV